MNITLTYVVDSKEKIKNDLVVEECMNATALSVEIYIVEQLYRVQYLYGRFFEEKQTEPVGTNV